MINIRKQAKYWRDSAKRDWKSAKILFENKRYDSSLFFCHLTLEKLLKGLVVTRVRKLAPFSHDLANLAETASLKLTEKRLETLRLINSFNISGRYDSLKMDFYKQCTKEYAERYLKLTDNLRKWLEKEYPKK